MKICNAFQITSCLVNSMPVALWWCKIRRIEAIRCVTWDFAEYVWRTQLPRDFLYIRFARETRGSFCYEITYTPQRAGMNTYCVRAHTHIHVSIWMYMY